MQYRFFHILAADPDTGTETLNLYLRKNAIHSIERQFVADGINSFWSVSVGTMKVDQAVDHAKGRQSERPKVDYQAILSPEHFTIFVKLREVRNQIAKQQSIPAYAVFTNEQLGEISQLAEINLSTLSHIKGVDHAVLKHQLRRRFRGDALTLVDAVIDAYHSEKGEKGEKGKALPIGSLTSQHFANHYLNEVDRWCLRQKRINAHCRYMDDFLFWSNDKKSLLDLSHALSEYLAAHLKLTIKAPKIQPTRQFLLFCGIKIRPFQLQASHRRKQRYKMARCKWESRWMQGDIDSTQLQNAYAAVQAILLPAKSVDFRQNELQAYGCVDA